ncbi:MAG: glycosyltransferase [Holosporaceae bacterium]|jgi:glycosyltransferase involved in cell wall biosynthesis|nr:glycosyltransferase [Holosporaceae bacterium]
MIPDLQKNNPPVSIIIPVYNGSDYIREAVDSALAQTYKNIEIIVVNDGSSDDTEEIALSYGNKIRYFSKKNGGVASALNVGIKNMKGEYFSWLSHDDVYLPNKIEKQIEELKNSDADTVLFGNWIAIDAEGNELTKTFYENKHYNPLFCVLFGLIHGCTLLIPKKCFDECGLFDESLRFTQDYDLWFRMFPKFQIKCIEDYLTKVRIHPKQGTRSTIYSNEESNDLWIRMIRQLSEKDIISLGFEESFFFRKIRMFLKRAHYYDAVRYVEKTMRERHGKFSVFSCLYDDCRNFLYKVFLRPLLKIIFGKNKVKRKFD